MSVYEQGVLGGLLHSPQKVKLVKDWLHPSDFSDKFLREVYAAILELSDKGMPIDLNFLTEMMQPKLPNINVFAELAQFISLTSMEMDVNYYGRHVIELKKRTDFITSLKLAILQAEEKKPLADIFDFCLKSIETLYRGVDLPTGQELTDIWAEYANDRHDEILGKKVLKIMTHYTALDSLLEGLRAGNLVTIAAGSGVGKTTFGLNVLRNVAVKDKIPVMLLSLEMNAREIGISTLAATSKLTQTTLKSDSNIDRERSIAAVSKSLSECEGVKFKVFSENIDKFSSAIRIIRSHLKAEPNCKLVMIDYVGLMSVDAQQSGKNSVRAYEIGYMTRTLKNLAQELGIVILILAQTNRDDKNRTDDEPPQLSDLRDSSSLGHDANVVMFLRHNPNSDVAKVTVAKNRSGAKGVASLGYRPDMAIFYNLEERI